MSKFSKRPDLTCQNHHLGAVEMNWLKRKKKKNNVKQPQKPTRGLLIYPHAATVVSVEEVLKDEGYDIRVVSPPPSYRTGCDLSVEIPLAEEAIICSILETIGLAPIDVMPITGKHMEPLRFISTVDYGDYLMVRAANMKMTVDKLTKEIVNISGGGCPDIPFIAVKMQGLRLRETPSPGEIGFSLCAYSLNHAYEEIIKLIGD